MVECSFEPPTNSSVCPLQEETITTKKTKDWLVYVDRSMAKTGSAHQLGATQLIVHIDSQLVATELNDEYKVKESRLKKYQGIETQLLVGFDKIQLASSIVIEQRGKILLDHRESPSYDVLLVYIIDQEYRWMIPIVRALKGISKPLLEDVLNKKGFSQPLLRCLTPSGAKYVM
ncbi:reverse transcriptase [Gossypium australe]|uniref:Reverse transcriptase n=1 Tax=Gossypium australe TaxID=47621 RepID=A0A5B6WV88_9ROSI|nr:reverse transcriptase [Gossypium australe]